MGWHPLEWADSPLWSDRPPASFGSFNEVATGDWNLLRKFPALGGGCTEYRQEVWLRPEVPFHLKRPYIHIESATELHKQLCCIIAINTQVLQKAITQGQL